MIVALDNAVEPGATVEIKNTRTGVTSKPYVVGSDPKAPLKIQAKRDDVLIFRVTDSDGQIAPGVVSLRYEPDEPKKASLPTGFQLRGSR